MEKLGPGDPRQIGPYRVLARLGAGGVGRVFLARSDRGRTAAVKLVKPELAEREEFRATLRQDVQAARRIGGPWTAPVLDADTDAATPWVATGYVPGPSLHDIVGREHGALPERSVHILAAGLAHALGDIHAAGLVHRALRPSNVLVTADGPRVVDAGLARAVDAAGGALAHTTRSSGASASAAFHAPEQVRGELVTPACDVFCLGSVLAYAATGRRPFGEASSGLHALLFRIAEVEPDLTGLPESLSELVSDCLRKDPAARPGVPEVLARTGARNARADGRMPEHWLPASLVAHLGGSRWKAPAQPTFMDGRDATERPAGAGPTTESGPTAGPESAPAAEPAPEPERAPASGHTAGSERGTAPGAGAGGRGPAPSGPQPTVISKGTSAAPSSPFVTPSPTGPFAPSGPQASPGTSAGSSPGTPAGSPPGTSPGRAAPAGPPAPGRAAPPGAAAAPGQPAPPGPPRPGGPGRPAPATASGTPNGTAAWPPVTHGSAAPRPDANGPALRPDPNRPAPRPEANRPAPRPGPGASGPMPTPGAGAGAPGPMPRPGAAGQAPHPGVPGAPGPTDHSSHSSTSETAPLPRTSGTAPLPRVHPGPRSAGRPAGTGTPAGRPPGAPAAPANGRNGLHANGHPGPLPPTAHGFPHRAPAPAPGAPAPGPGPRPGPASRPGQGPHPAQVPAPAEVPPAPSTNRRRSTVALIVAALIVVTGAGASVYALMHGNDGGARTAPTASPSRGGGQGAGAKDGRSQPPAPVRTSRSPQGPGLVPARYLGTWNGSINTSSGHSSRRLVITQGEVGDTVLSLTADGPAADGGYHCVFKAPLQSEPTAKGPLRIGPSVVTEGEPATSCSPGAPTTVTVLPDGRLQRTNTDTGEKLTYAKGR
ncbi:serine/threonine-protein kinase [Streptomyces sp. TS71-3]|uniref:serine/threonine-protein kinase n=1 Tax=Streptomyces sp. TS71-3 TaxID=2733862 RepID=UPI001B0D7366|nr:serine/threonine-protein kinase [Streptomyces sp. TS71-3]GHJ40010.1 hypothetical protein Sm713_56190 [Streptomyces sp. TS71-3]